MPLLSIITINYNNAEGLQKTMQSVFEQSFTDFEYIIVDGGSTDGSKEYIESNADKLTFWVSESDKGIYDAMNKAISKSTGEYLMFLNSGDYLLGKDVFSTTQKYIAEVQADIYYGNIELEDEKGKKNIQTYLPKLSLQFWEEGTINHQACFIKATLFMELGFYETPFSLAADYAFFLKAFVYGKKFSYINLDMVYYCINGQSKQKKEEYVLQAKEIWNMIIPGHINEMYSENKAFKLLMKHRIMLQAKRLNTMYSNLKKSFKF